MYEVIVNLHMHTAYSDGTGSHLEIANTAIRAGLDAVIVTDHNVFVDGPEDVYIEGERKVLLLVGEEIHDQSCQPQKNHLLVIGAGLELAPLAGDLDRLLEAVQKNNGLSFMAHPIDPAAPTVNQEDLSWDDWQIKGMHGLEIWNGFSEFKSLLKTKLHAIYYAYNPTRIATGPFPEALEKWDNLLLSGRRLVAIGGSDAHALKIRLGPLHRIVFPYEFHFRTINSHVLLERPFEGSLETDRALLLDGLRRGRVFIANDMLSPARGFRFTAHGYDKKVIMGDKISSKRGITFQIRLPARAECRLICNGRVVQSWMNQTFCAQIATEPGAYRAEAYLPYKGKRRGWIFSNPIYVTI